MISNRLAVGLLGVACVVAAAGGGYLATRQNAVPMPASASELTESALPAAQPVQETEAIVGEPLPSTPVAEPPAPAQKAEPARPAQPTRRTEPGRQVERPRTVARAETTSPAPALEQSWPSNAEPPTPPAAPIEDAAPTLASPEEHQVAGVPETPERTFDELVVSADSVVGLQIENAISSQTARVEDRVEARVVRDVRVGGQAAIPAGSRVEGSVTVVERGGKFKERARLGIRFHQIVLADGTRLNITTDTIYRYGDTPGNSSAAKIGGGAVAGAILGAILGGAKGAAIGATAGAGGGTAATMASDPSIATFPAGTELTARFLSPVNVTVEK